ncbi:UDP-glucose/GDP-mannose dehydrogenase family protein [Sporosarcina sp. E16_8]|uniref:nucleotide sugar dehydrogenase n=1 Tax=Sporosarcina sp. E16_8 TaxID=2789295 RepID=UPI001A92C0DF|nr:UDP-glucose/GDP-mannose dehydrogenase family protein [Sporosarcina sp. E16_8]
MNITVIGTGYVGLVTGVALSEIGNNVVCYDVDEAKIRKMSVGVSPIYEPNLEELMIKNINSGRLLFTNNAKEAYRNINVLYIAVGTPEKEDGSANLTFIDQVIQDIGMYINNDIIIVTKSTVPIGTNHYIKSKLESILESRIKVEVVSNPEFLREGSSVNDTFHGDRIIIGSDSFEAGMVVEKINKPFGIPIYQTDILSAEMIKYASNAFLATKISFINEIANICERVGADISNVAEGMGLDSRIGNKFLNAGIGYGGSCFPKDTQALANIAENIDYDFKLLKSVIEVNNSQHLKLVNKAIKRFGSVKGKRVGILGLSFKPNTDDMRESPAITIINKLIKEGAKVVAFDPISMNKAKEVLPKETKYVDDVIDVISNSDMVFILTDWSEFKELNLSVFVENVEKPVIFDGRNCFKLEEVSKYEIEYHSIGRKSLGYVFDKGG